MGANGSYNKSIGGVPANSRSHTDTNYRICGHKVVVQTIGPKQAKNIMYSNSDSPIYLIGRLGNDNTIQIHSINIFEGHKLSIEVNLKYDHNGRLLPYNGSDTHTHSHSWIELPNGGMNRKPKGHEELPNGLSHLLDEIVLFNRKNKKTHGNK